MKERYNKHEIAVIVLFVGILFAMLFGMAAPSVCRRLVISLQGDKNGSDAEAVTESAVSQQPDETTEPVDFAQKYPFDVTTDTQSAAGLYEKIQSVESNLKGRISIIEDAVNEQVPGRTHFIEAYIQIQKLLGSRVIDGDDVVVKMNNGLLTFLSDRLTDEEANTCISNLEGLADYAKTLGADFLYVQTPNKVNKYDNQLPAGVEDYANDNADRLTEALTTDGYSVLDLRDEIVGDMDFDSAFYASDHHWKPRTGLWAARKILETMNARLGTDFDADKCSQDAYDEKIYEHIFLGALGKKTGLGYVPLDDMNLLTPKFSTDFTMKIVGSGRIYEGDFTHTFIDQSQLVADYYNKNPYAAYFRDDQALVEVTNHEILKNTGSEIAGNGGIAQEAAEQETGQQETAGTPRVLLLKDSFGLTTAPFLATAISELDVIDLRYFNGSLEKYMEETRPDIVVVMYNPKAITAPVGYHADLFDFQ